MTYEQEKQEFYSRVCYTCGEYLDENGNCPEAKYHDEWKTEYNYEKKHWDDLATWNERFAD